MCGLLCQGLDLGLVLRAIDRCADPALVLKQYSSDWLEAFLINKRFGNARNNEASLIDP